ncbi:pleiotropic drug resistance protein 1-like protein [Tanacetum coccineum]
MEGSDIHKASTSSIRLGSLRASSGPARSIRAASTSLWRNSGMDVFSKSSREENDEEALKWAALEKLPTFDRLKKGLLFGSTGPCNEVDIDNLGDQDRKRLVDRLVNAADEDNEKFLLRLRNRIDRVGIDLPTIEVKFEHLTVEADVKTGSRALPSFFNFFLDFFEGILNIFHLLPNKKKRITILDDVSGIVKPGNLRITLCLHLPNYKKRKKRNGTIFNSKKLHSDMLLGEVKTIVFLWLNSGWKNVNIGGLIGSLSRLPFHSSVCDTTSFSLVS